jgi:hypothetical protein
LRRGLSKSFGEISRFWNMGLGLLDRRMGNREFLEFKRLIVSW